MIRAFASRQALVSLRKVPLANLLTGARQNDALQIQMSEVIHCNTGDATGRRLTGTTFPPLGASLLIVVPLEESPQTSNLFEISVRGEQRRDNVWLGFGSLP